MSFPDPHEQAVAEHARRRRGDALEDALLDAAWTVLRSGSYANFTIDAVAKVAGTSRPVIYRRWPNRAELAVAALRAHVVTVAEVEPNTGSLRGDMLVVLRLVASRFDELPPDVINGLLSEYSALPSAMVGAIPELIARVIDAAVARGELSTDAVPAYIRDLPWILVRYDIVVNHRKPDEARLVEIVDGIFLPLATGH